MYSKLAFRNVKKSFRDYAIYFLTLMFGVCIFYVFNSIDAQQSMMVITESTNEQMETLRMIIGHFSVFVVAILGFLIVYANRFLIRRRKKELGIYQTLGMERGQISGILTIETLLIAILSLAVGLVVGVFVSQGFAVLTASLFEVKLADFKFVFSSVAAIKAVIYFGISFLLVLFFNRITIGRQKLIDLLYAERKNEKFRIPHLMLSAVIFVVSIACLGVAYYLVLKPSIGYQYQNKAIMIAMVLGLVGTFLFFFSLSGFFLKVTQQMKGVYFKGLNMFVLRQINSKINTAYVSITLVCLMLFLSICGLSFGMGFSKAITSDLERLHPYDASSYLMASIPDSEDEPIDTTVVPVDVMAELDVMTELNKLRIPLNSYAKEVSVIRINQLVIPSENYSELTENGIMTLSDYNKCLALQGLAPATLKDNEMIFNCLSAEHQEVLSEYINHNKMTVSGTDLALKNIDETVLYNVAVMGNYVCILVLPDALLEDAIPFVDIINVQFIDDTTECKDLYLSAMTELHDNLESVDISVSSTTKSGSFEASKSTSVTIAYLAVYLGVIFAVMATVVLAIAQLSEASDNAQRYSLLRKLGADSKMINSALFQQIAIYFGVPLLLAIVHSVVGINFSNKFLSLVGKTSILRDSLITTGMLIVVYGGYFLATYFGSKRIIKGNK